MAELKGLNQISKNCTQQFRSCTSASTVILPVLTGQGSGDKLAVMKSQYLPMKRKTKNPLQTLMGH